MAEHIITFSHFKEEDYPDPKDKLPWKVDLEAESKYKCYNRRYIVTTDEEFDRHALPIECPEVEWK